jgi:hypothetical protein
VSTIDTLLNRGALEEYFIIENELVIRKLAKMAVVILQSLEKIKGKYLG